jgi:hypothetical protein
MNEKVSNIIYFSPTIQAEIVCINDPSALPKAETKLMNVPTLTGPILQSEGSILEIRVPLNVSIKYIVLMRKKNNMQNFILESIIKSIMNIEFNNPKIKR